MKLLLDSNILIAMTRGEVATLGAAIASALRSPDNVCFASAASLWEIAIKTRLGKLDPGMRLDELAEYLRRSQVAMLAVNEHHAVTAADPEPPTRDPFDRMLLSQCQVEDMRIVTLDQALSPHPLAWRPT
jgi:PIN domain nuclease of toxin-antitoxin system